MSAEPPFTPSYLVSGAYDPIGQKLQDGALVLLPNLLLARKGSSLGDLLLMTNEFGAICAARADAATSTPLRLHPKDTLEVQILPADTLQRTYFALDSQWKTELTKKIAELSAPIKPIAVKFTPKHLERIADLDRAATVRRHFRDGTTYEGRLLPRLRVLAILVDEKALKVAPATMEIAFGGKKVQLRHAPELAQLEVVARSAARYHVYSGAGPNMPQGDFVASLPAGALAARFITAKRRASFERRSFAAAYAMRSLFADFDFHVFAFPSVESAILLHFADKYGHLIGPASPISREEADASGAKPEGTYAAREESLVRVRGGLRLFYEKQKTVTGYLDPMASLVGGLERIALGALRDPSKPPLTRVAEAKAAISRTGKRAEAVAGHSPAQTAAKSALETIAETNDRGVPLVAQYLLQAWDGYNSSRELLEKWRKLKITRQNAAALGLAVQAIDGGFLRRMYHGSKWLDFAVRAIDQAEKNERGAAGYRLGRYLLTRKENAKPELIRKAVVRALHAPTPEFAKGFLSKAAKGVGMDLLDLAMTAEQVAYAAHELSRNIDSAKIEANTVGKHLHAYQKAYDGKPALDALVRLDSLRRAADLALSGVDTATATLIRQSWAFTTKVMTMVPVAREVSYGIQLLGVAYELAGSAYDVVCDAVDRVWPYLGAHARMTDLAAEHALQCRAIETALESGDNQAHVQWRLRIIMIIGLLRLIERCGSRHGRVREFDEKVAQYRIGEYIQQFLQPYDTSKLRSVFVQSGTPMDEQWLYLFGNEDRSWNDKLSILADWCKDAVAKHAPGQLWTEALHGTHAKMVGVDYHRYFPILGSDNRDMRRLVSLFSLNFAPVIRNQLVYSRVYYDTGRKDEVWYPVTAKSKLSPFTRMRVVAVFSTKDGADLTGVPVSLQVRRIDGLDTDGPVYKTALQPVAKARKGEEGFYIDDKGLLPYLADEAAYIGCQDLYSCVFYPFYFYRGAYLSGIKPIGSFPEAKPKEMEVELRLAMGKDTSLVRTNDGEAFTVRFDKGSRDQLEMASDPVFLAHKSSQPYLQKLFSGDPKDITVVGVFTRGKSASGSDNPVTWHHHPPGANGCVELRPGGDFDFSWISPFELLVVFAGHGTNQGGWAMDPIRFGARLIVAESAEWYRSNPVGPSYECEVLSLDRSERVKDLVVADVSRGLAHTMPDAVLDKLLVRAGLLKSGEHLKVASIPEIRPGSLFALRASFDYQVEDRNGGMKVVQALKPFGREYKVAVTGDTSPKYQYLLDLQAPDPIGLKLEKFLHLELPGIPADLLSNTAFESPYWFVTQREYWPLTRVERIRK